MDVTEDFNTHNALVICFERRVGFDAIRKR